eukprot:TRINITY_DN3049_c0_g1_i5.p1 TRINITY_DN3049_c0_g1~~TRINITY_DN3049_c0_g1_i5.p1  ORF type:complete len:374 (-),score=52.47 TRINITY_DN3049_c0_g1_i5:716-1750(-)
MTTESDGIIFTEIDWTSPDLWDDSDLIKAWNETDKSKRNRKKKNVRKEQPGNEAQRETQEIDTKTMEGKPNDHEQNQYDSRSQKYNEGYANHYSYPMYYPVQGDFSNQHTISDYPSAFHVGQQNPHECLHRFVPGSYPMYPFAPFTYPHYPPSRSPHPSHHPHVQSHVPQPPLQDLFSYEAHSQASLQASSQVPLQVPLETPLQIPLETSLEAPLQIPLETSLEAPSQARLPGTSQLNPQDTSRPQSNSNNPSSTWTFHENTHFNGRTQKTQPPQGHSEPQIQINCNHLSSSSGGYRASDIALSHLMRAWYDVGYYTAQYQTLKSFEDGTCEVQYCTSSSSSSS